ncbi:MAG: radical SAM protein [Anaerolineaceae bacterium]
MTCTFEPDLTLDEFTLRLLSPLGVARFPLSASMELTNRCNLNCVHCYINQPATDPSIAAKELDAQGWQAVIDQMAEAGTLFLLISGGEPLLREDFPEIFKYAVKRGMLVSLFSNATMLTPKLADFLVEWGLHSLEVSLYGATRETYEKVTRQPGSYDRCLRGIELAQSRGIKVSLKTVLLTSNLHELEEMQALTNKLGLDFRYDSTLWPRLDGTRTNLQYQINNQVSLMLDLADPKRRESWEKTAQEFKGHQIREKLVFSCGAGHRSFHIDATGRMTPCMMVRSPASDILSLGFSEAWERTGRIRNLKRTMKTDCETCQAGTLCTQCPGWSLAQAGDYESIYPEICEMGLLRQTQFSKASV